MSKFLKYLIVLSATVLMGIAENSTIMMCGGFLDEIEVPEEIKNTKFKVSYIISM